MEIKVVNLLKRISKESNGSMAKMVNRLLSSTDIVNAILGDFESTRIVYDYLNIDINKRQKFSAVLRTKIGDIETCKFVTKGYEIKEVEVRAIVALKLLSSDWNSPVKTKGQMVRDAIFGILKNGVSSVIPTGIIEEIEKSVTINFEAKVNNSDTQEEEEERRKEREKKAREAAKKAREEAKKAREEREEAERKAEEAKKAEENSANEKEREELKKKDIRKVNEYYMNGLDNVVTENGEFLSRTMEAHLKMEEYSKASAKGLF